jgi:hypothetical protein
MQMIFINDYFMEQFSIVCWKIAVKLKFHDRKWQWFGAYTYALVWSYLAALRQ